MPQAMGARYKVNLKRKAKNTEKTLQVTFLSVNKGKI
jgi:hypothetical protein